MSDLHSNCRRILLTSVGSYGDVIPFIAIGKQLVDRGYDVTMLTSGYFTELVESHGIKIAPVGKADQYLQYIRNPGLSKPIRGLLLSRKMLISILEPIHAYIAEHWNSKDSLILSSPYVMSSRIAAEQFGLPLITAHLTTLSLGSFIDPPTMFNGMSNRGKPRFIARVSANIAHGVADLLFGTAVNALRRKCELRPVRRVMQWWNSPAGSILLFPEWFGQRREDWPSNAVHVGFPETYAADANVDEDLEEFLQVTTVAGQEGSPLIRPILFLPGSNDSRLEHYERVCQEACKKLNRRGVLIAPAADKCEQRSTPEFLVRKFVPLAKILDRVDAVVHHGGVGTIAACLRAGVPQLMRPRFMDQPENAERACLLGIGQIIFDRNYQVDHVAKILGQLCTDKDIRERCDHYRKLLEGQDGAAIAADYIEQQFPQQISQGHWSESPLP